MGSNEREDGRLRCLRLKKEEGCRRGGGGVRDSWVEGLEAEVEVRY